MGSQSDGDACRTACSAEDSYDYLGCYGEDSETTPDTNSLCYTEYECESEEITLNDGSTSTGTWGGQAYQCPSGEGYCYNSSSPLALNVTIGQLSEAGTLAEYIAAIYDLVIPIAGLISVVTLMIAGMQYILARGDSGKLGRAKERIHNVIVGIILLLGAYTIAYYIDPNLVNFKAIGVPRVKTIVFIDPNATCEVLIESGFEVTADGSESCGVTGEVTGVSEDSSVSADSIEEGHECVFTTCSSPMETCMAVGDSYACHRCGHVGGDDSDLDPNGGNCSMLFADDYADELNADNKFLYCEYFDAAVLATDWNACVEIVYPDGEDYLDCDLLEQDAIEEHGAVSCRAYDMVMAQYECDIEESGVVDCWSNEIDDKDDADGEYGLAELVCNSSSGGDPCGFAPPDETCQIFTPESTISSEAEEELNLAEEYILEELGIFVNCANSQSAYGYDLCRDRDGNEFDCPITE